MATQTVLNSGFRDLSDIELSAVAGGTDEVEEIVVTGRRMSWAEKMNYDFNHGYGSYWQAGWGTAAAAGGSYSGVVAAGHAAEVVAIAVEYGVIGAEYGALAGPVGVVAGVAVGALTGYVIYNYGPQIAQSAYEVMQ